MESQFKELKDMVNSTLSERKGQDSALELAKTRGKRKPHCAVMGIVGKREMLTQI